jgi:ADP-ribosylation factor GTPase-activating protein 1
MDAFKTVEILRMDKGGNKPWQDFFNAHEHTKALGTSFDEATIKERYEGEVGEEYKERLTAKVEEREYVPGPRTEAPVKTASAAGSRSGTPVGRMGGMGSETLRSSSPANSIRGGKKAQNEAFFASKGAENASRPADLHPSQGGKYAGFGSQPFEPSGSSEEKSLPGADDFAKDPVAALSKGFGWFTSTVGKNAKAVNDGWIQPTAAIAAQRVRYSHIDNSAYYIC